MSTRPDPATDLVGSLRWIMEHLAAIEQVHEERRVNATEAALALGHSASFFRGHPWRVPGFGRHGTMHTIATWRAWHERTDGELRAEWDAMSIAERSRIRRSA